MRLINKILITIVVSLIAICAFSLTALASGECQHIGGEAKCDRQAICELCGERYGELNPENHSNYDFVYAYSDPLVHEVRYFCCGEIVRTEMHKGGEATCSKMGRCYYCRAEYLETLPHNFSEPSCTYPKICYDCDATEGELLPHTGGQAGCLTLANCEVCGVEYGDVLGHMGGEPTCTRKAICERCGDEYGDLAPHTGGTPNCQSPAICTVCNTAYGELGIHIESEEWTIEKEFHYKKCAVNGCGEVVDDGDHEDGNKDGKCDTCNHKYKLSQTQVILIIVASCVGAVLIIGATVAIIVLVKKKKAKNK